MGGVVALVAELLKDTVEQSSPLNLTAVGVMLIGTALKIHELLRNFRVWRILRPEYRGLDDFVRRINSSPLFAAAFLTRGPGEAAIDASALIAEMRDLLPRIDFVGDDPALNTIAAQINASAFSGSLYHATPQAKLARNRPLARRQPASFALIRASDAAFSHAGLSVVLPMNAAGLAAYLTGKLSDNDIAPRHMARFGDEPEALLVFLIASGHIGDSKPPHSTRGVFDLLVQLCLLQIVALTAQSEGSREVQVLVANAAPKWAEAFSRMQFVKCPEFGSADQQTVFECRLTVQDARVALDSAMMTVPRFAVQLAAPEQSTPADLPLSIDRELRVP